MAATHAEAIDNGKRELEIRLRIFRDYCLNLLSMVLPQCQMDIKWGVDFSQDIATSHQKFLTTVYFTINHREYTVKYLSYIPDYHYYISKNYNIPDPSHGLCCSFIEALAEKILTPELIKKEYIYNNEVFINELSRM